MRTRTVFGRDATTAPSVTVAVMGCPVNGPGEAREADVGLAGGREEGLLFLRGEIIGRVPRDRMVDALMEEIEKL